MHTFPTKMNYVAFSIPLCTVYCNTVLANLNARQYIRNEMTRHSVDTDQVVPAVVSRGMEAIMISTDRQKEKKISISSAPLVQVSSHDDDASRRSRFLPLANGHGVCLDADPSW